jgi:hypothetical protein
VSFCLTKRKIFFLTWILKNQSYVIVTENNGDRTMKRLIVSIFIMLMAGSSVYASGCNKMAAFNTKINKALKTASFNQKTLADLKNLQSECKRQHDMGMSVSSIGSCNKALDLVAVN